MKRKIPRQLNLEPSPKFQGFLFFGPSGLMPARQAKNLCIIRSKSLSVASKAVAVLFALVFINLRSPADIH
jgi:hypothetical protein